MLHYVFVSGVGGRSACVGAWVRGFVGLWVHRCLGAFVDVGGVVSVSLCVVCRHGGLDAIEQHA